MAMNPEVKAEWVKALRSGEYEQTTGLLHRTVTNEWGNQGYCCLGVLCDLAVKANLIIPENLGDKVRYGGTDIDLPRSVQRWAGIDDSNGGADEGIIDDLIGYNDEGQDFAYIADQIEARF